MFRKFVAVAGLIVALAVPSAYALTGKRDVLLSGGIPAWVLSGAAQDMNFATAQYYSCSTASCLTLTRASSKTDLLPSSASGFAYNTFGSGVLAITPGKGLLIEESRTNQLFNSTAPATQTTGTLANGTYTLWVNGSGTATMSAGTATGCGTGVASQGTPVNFTTSGAAGNCIITVAGSLNAFQLELGAFGTSLIVTAGATATRAADNITINAPITTVLNGASGQVFLQLSSSSTLFPVVTSGNTTMSVLEEGNSTLARTFNSANSLNANLGTGTWATGLKSVTSWTPSGRALVVNNGTEGSDANTINNGSAVTTWYFGSLTGTLRFVDGYISRFAVWKTPNSATVRKALTQ